MLQILSSLIYIPFCLTSSCACFQMNGYDPHTRVRVYVSTVEMCRNTISCVMSVQFCWNPSIYGTYFYIYTAYFSRRLRDIVSVHFFCIFFTPVFYPTYWTYDVAECKWGPLSRFQHKIVRIWRELENVFTPRQPSSCNCENCSVLKWHLFFQMLEFI